MMDRGNISRVELEHGDLRVSVRARGAARSANVAREASTPVDEVSDDRTDQPMSDNGLHTITAPLVGTFYVSPAPNEPAFVRPGDEIEEEQTVGIIEAMKIMNEIAADRSGEVVEILAKDGETVEYGSPLILVKPLA